MKGSRYGPSAQRPNADSGARTEERAGTGVAEGTQSQFDGSRPANAGGDAEREGILRETYRLNHELGYIGFRHRYFHDIDAIKEWPDPAVRERELRRFWDNARHGGFASYYESHASESIRVLSAHRDHLRGLLAGDKGRQMAYYDQVSEMGRSMRLREAGLQQAGADGETPASPGELGQRNPAHGQRQNQNHRRGRGH
jgi:hypothetical protein